MKHFKIFIELTRLNKPIGFMLLFWPCSWGLTYAQSYNQNSYMYFYYLILFFFGSLLMRSAGCIFNDIVDKDFDKKVKRTKKRPLAANIISVKHAFFYVVSLCLLAFFILIQFNLFTIFLGLSSMLLAFSYPFMKRITFWPQLFLGLTFNWGIIMAWTAMGNQISTDIILLYISAIFWTLGYDTIYGAQDVSDDEIIGLKSTAIKFKKYLKLFVFITYFITVLLLSYLFFNQIGLNTFSFFLLLFRISLFYQIMRLKEKRRENYLNIFKLNNFSGRCVAVSGIAIGHPNEVVFCME